jgi:hypothetical protein
MTMVIITTTVAKIYFPEALERGTRSGLLQARTFNYRMTDAYEYYGCNHEEEKSNSDSAKMDDDADGDNEVLDSDEDDDALVGKSDCTKKRNPNTEVNDLLTKMSQEPHFSRTACRAGQSLANNNFLEFAMSAFSTVLSLITLIHTKELYPAIAMGAVLYRTKQKA